MPQGFGRYCMMNLIFKAFAKKLFGAGYERLGHTVPVCLLMFAGLRAAKLRFAISPSVLYLTVSMFTAGMMWQALSSEDQSASMQNMLMLPFDRRKFILSYVTVLGIYTILTKTAVLAVSAWTYTEFWGTLLCMIHAVFLAACIYGQKRNRGLCMVWAAVMTGLLIFLREETLLFPAVAASSIFALGFLQGMDGYVFYAPEKGSIRIRKSGGTCLVWRYLIRYLICHKNYLMNTAILWCAACVLPSFLGQIERWFVIPMGFAVLSLNTPLCILLSCDPALEQAVRFLPDGKKRFCIPYCLFLFLCNLASDGLYLGSFWLQKGGVTFGMIAAAVVFALQSAVLSVLLEWFYPLRGWKIESDLWHHPRKYAVPAVMLFLAGAVGTAPGILPVLMILPAVFCIISVMTGKRMVKKMEEYNDEQRTGT